MHLKAALSVIPRPRPGTLPTRELTAVAKADPARLASYQSVCGFRLSERLPLPYPHIVGFDLAMRLMSGFDFPFPVIGLVHVNNRIEQRRALTLADELTVTAQAVDLREHPRGQQFDMVTTASVDGVEVWRENSTYLRISRKQGSERREQAAPVTPHALWRVGTRVGHDYAAASGDHNPIHTSKLGARIFGFPKPIAHGMWSLARCVAALEGRLPEALSVDAAFKSPILLPGKVGFVFADQGFSLFDAKSGRPHLIGRIAA